MANFFADLIRKVVPDRFESAIGLAPKPKPMVFPIEKENVQGIEKIKQLVEGGKELSSGNFFADLMKPRLPDVFPYEQAKKTYAPLLTKKLRGEEFTPQEKEAFSESGKVVQEEITSAALGFVGGAGGKIGKTKKLAPVAQKGLPEAIPAEKGIIPQIVGTKALKITERAEQKIADTAKSIGEELSKIKGKSLTYQEVKKAAETSSILRRATTKEETLAREAKIQATKKHLAALAEGKEITPEFVDTLKILSSEATNLGRQLNSLKIEASPELATSKAEIVKKLLDMGIESEKIIRAAKGVDFTNAKELTKFYRSFVKPKFTELIDEYRYINLLSSPKTHIVNAFSNLLQITVLGPAVKLVSGGIDLIGSSLIGKARNHYIRETPVYYKGAFNSFGDAIRGVFEVLKGKQQIFRPDVKNIPTGSKLLAPFQFIPRILEASDIFFRTIAKGGEKEALAYRAIRQGKKTTPKLLADIEREANEKSQYLVFRGGLKNQGKVLETIDKFTSLVYRLREFPIVKWFVPFIATPMNILKQGIEFSPAGATTLLGASNKTEQLAKTMIGSLVFAGAGYAALKGDSTWEAPKDEKEKQYFYASGRQPYSLKVGDKWVNYSKLGPLAYPIAMAAAINYYTRQNPQRVSDDTLAKVSKIISGIGGFFADQSYVQGIGNFIETMSGDVYAFGKMMANLPSQVVPLASLQRWVGNIVDPIFRQTKKGVSLDAVIDNLKNGIPGLKQSLPAFKEPFGEESKRQFPLTNALSPVGITAERKDYQELYDLLLQKREMSAELRKMKEDLKRELGL